MFICGAFICGALFSFMFAGFHVSLYRYEFLLGMLFHGDLKPEGGDVRLG